MRKFALLFLLALPLFAQTSTNDNRGSSVPASQGATIMSHSGTGTTMESNRVLSLRSTAANRDVSLHFFDTSNFANIDLLGSSLLFGTAGTERMRVNSTGVGIGVTPTSKLTVLGGSANNIQAGAWVANAAWSALSVSGDMNLGANIISQSGAGQPLIINRGTGREISFRRDNVEQVNISDGGNVGIGGTPATRLHVFGASSGATVATFRAFDTLSTDLAVFERQDSLVRARVRYDGGTGTVAFGTSTAHPVALTTGGTDRLTINSSGNATFSGTITERNRSTPMGEWIAFTPTMTAATGTWTGGTVEHARYTLVGKTMTVSATITGTSVSSATANLRITIPDGRTSAARMVGVYSAIDNGGVQVPAFMRSTSAGGNYIEFYSTVAGAGWAISAGTTSVQFTHTFEIQ